MELADKHEPLIDPEVRAFVFSLVSALGGSSAGNDGRYVLGDDALAVLKDIKRWLRLYDDKTNRLDVARLLAEANLVKGDLLEILAAWPEDAAEGSFRSKIALLCVDLLTQLTWPLDKDEQTLTSHHLLHQPYLSAAQASYKRAVLQHDTSKILRKVVRVALPAMATTQKERSPVEDNIIKVVLYLVRNMALINPPANKGIDEEDTEISRSATIDAFHHQDIFSVLLTVGSNMTDEFSTHDVELLDILFHLVKGVDVEKLFMDEENLVSSNTKELQSLLGKEKGMMAGYARNAPSRHNRFGTMTWLKRDDGKFSTVMGQTASAGSENVTLHEMDKSKKWKRPQHAGKKGLADSLTEFNGNVALTASARRHLRCFVEQFLDSSFNPLFLSVRRSIEREVSRVLDHHSRQYFFLISWFLRAECARRRKQALDKKQATGTTQTDVESFALVATVLNQETFVLLNRQMQYANDHKIWQDLNACMKCFTQILLTVQEMSESELDDDQEISENTLNRIFYEATTHDRIIGLLRTYKDQGFGYLDACTELAHVFLRLLERYSKQNVDMQVRSLRRARRKKKAADKATNDAENTGRDQEIEAEDVAEAHRTSTERKFDFNRFAARFVNQGSIETYVALARYYRDLSTEQLKRAHRFFYRAAFKMDLSVYLFRADIILLFNKMIKGPEGMDHDEPTFKEWEELVQQVFRRLVKKMQERPALNIELLFSKMPPTVFYLEYGHDKVVDRKIPRAPADLEVKPGLDMTPEQKIGIAVSILINQGKSDILTWVKNVLSSAADERQSWEDEAEARRQLESQDAPTVAPDTGDAAQIRASQEVPPDAQPTTETQDGPQTETQTEKPTPGPILVRPDSEERRMSMQRDKHLRLLLNLLGFNRLDITQSDIEHDGFLTSWTIPGSLSSTDLTQSRELIARLEFSPPTYEDGKTAEDHLRRKAVSLAASDGARDRQRGTAQDGESDSEGASDVEALFPAGGPTTRRPDHEPKKTRKHRNRHTPELLDEETLDARRAARRRTERERALKIKSNLFVSVSDDESDQERDAAFFDRESMLRGEMESKVSRAARGEHVEGVQIESATNKKAPGPPKPAKRKAGPFDDDSSDDSDGASERSARHKRKRQSIQTSESESAQSSDSDVDIELPAAGRPRQARRSRKRASPGMSGSDDARSSSPALAERDSERETDTDTPASSQRPSSGNEPKARPDGDDVSVGSEDSDKENAGVVVRPLVADKARAALPPARRNNVVVESDSDE